jgi:hypothetical protein
MDLKSRRSEKRTPSSASASASSGKWRTSCDRKYTESQAYLEKTKVAGRILGALGEAGVAQLFPKGSAGHQNVRQQIAERILDSVTKEQTETIFPVLNQEQQVMLANFIRLGVEAQGARHRPRAIPRPPPTLPPQRPSRTARRRRGTRSPAVHEVVAAQPGSLR